MTGMRVLGQTSAENHGIRFKELESDIISAFIASGLAACPDFIKIISYPSADAFIP
jgi:hypothetical protein